MMWLAQIPGHPGYLADAFSGDIYSFKFRVPRRLVPSLTHDGYPRVTLSNKNIRMNHTVHRLVALTFVPNPENKPTVNHKNGNRADARAVNLEWLTHQEQTLHSMRVTKTSAIIRPRTKEGYMK
jgi:hypothetical protein